MHGIFGIKMMLRPFRAFMGGGIPTQGVALGYVCIAPSGQVYIAGLGKRSPSRA
jgi:hypothetical protein